MIPLPFPGRIGPGVWAPIGRSSKKEPQGAEGVVDHPRGRSFSSSSSLLLPVLCG